MPTPRPFATWPVTAIALGVGGLLLAFAGSYGPHRDELYFRVAGRHLDWGYPDQPPLTPLLGRVSIELFGDTTRGMRVVACLAAVAMVVIGALIARECGAGRRGQILAALAVGITPPALALGHLVSTATFDALAWMVIALLVARALRTGSPAAWIGAGLALGVALENKHLPLLLVGGIGLGLLLARRDVLRTRWPYIALSLAAVIWLPNVLWQASHGWPQLELGEQISEEDPLGQRIDTVILQPLLVGLFLAPLAVLGLLRLLRDEALRPLGIAYPAALAAVLLTGGKGYYLAGLLPVLLAAGAAACEDALTRRRGRVLVIAGVMAAAATTIVIALPVLPEDDLAGSPVEALNEDALESVRWPRFTAAVADAARQVPASERARLVVLASNYGEAGAIDRYGPALGLPAPYSGHNGFGLWGPPPNGARPVLAVGFASGGRRDRILAGCRDIARYDNGLDLDQEEQGASIALCTGPRGSWAAVWPEVRFLSA